jgi:hypothetical protein
LQVPLPTPSCAQPALCLLVRALCRAAVQAAAAVLTLVCAPLHAPSYSPTCPCTHARVRQGRENARPFFMCPRPSRARRRSAAVSRGAANRGAFPPGGANAGSFLSSRALSRARTRGLSPTPATPAAPPSRSASPCRGRRAPTRARAYVFEHAHAPAYAVRSRTNHQCQVLIEPEASRRSTAVPAMTPTSPRRSPALGHFLRTLATQQDLADLAVGRVVLAP